MMTSDHKPYAGAASVFMVASAPRLSGVRVIRAVTTVSAVAEEMEHEAQREQNEWQRAEQVCLMFGV
jgi:hypothetical protein